MLDDFFTRAIVAGVGVAIVAGPLGCFVVWRRLAYFGDTLSHAALLGFAVSALVAFALLGLRRTGSLSSDALLGLLSHSALAIGLVVLAFMTWVRIDLMGYLFGDILAVSRFDILAIYVGGAVVLAILAAIWHPLFAATVNRELAEAEGLDPAFADLIFMLLLASVVAIALKLVGALLVTAMLIIPAATARRFAASPEVMAGLAALFGALAVIFGLFGSLHWDTPSGPSIVVAALALFLLGLLPLPTGLRLRRGADARAQLSKGDRYGQS